MKPLYLPRAFMALVAALFLLVVPTAHAATGASTVSWVRPVTYTDGSALAASELTGYDVQCTFRPTGGSTAACAGLSPATLAGGLTTAQVTITYPGNTGGRVCFRLVAKTATASSDPSNEACKDLPALKPSPPTDVVVTITVSTTAR